MTGNSLLKKIKDGLVCNYDKFIYKNENDNHNEMFVYFDNGLLYFNLFGQHCPLTSKDLLFGTFEKCLEKDRLYNQAMKRLKRTNSIIYENDTYSAIAELEQLDTRSL